MNLEKTAYCLFWEENILFFFLSQYKSLRRSAGGWKQELGMCMKAPIPELETREREWHFG